MASSSKRMIRDIKVFLESKPEESGIHMIFKEADIFTIYLMIVGHDKTPYEDGIFFIKLVFHKSKHPHVPPKAIFYQGASQFRLHPNLYQNGNVCLSLLNTWKGPAWSSCQTLLSIANTLKTLFTENPLTHEPGFESDFLRQQKYNELIEYANIFNLFRVYQLRDRHAVFSLFKDEIETHLKKSISRVLSKLQVHVENPLKFAYNFDLYRMKGKYEYNFLLDEFTECSEIMNDPCAFEEKNEKS